MANLDTRLNRLEKEVDTHMGRRCPHCGFPLPVPQGSLTDEERWERLQALHDLVRARQEAETAGDGSTDGPR